MEFAVIKDAVPIAAETIISSFNKVSLTEMTTTLGFTTITRPTLLTTSKPKVETSLDSKTIIIAFVVPLAVLLVCLFVLLHQRWKLKVRLESYADPRQPDSIAGKSDRHSQQERSQSIVETKIAFGESSGKSLYQSANDHAESSSKVRGEKYRRKSMGGLDSIHRRHSQGSQDDMTEIDVKRMKRRAQKNDADDITSVLTPIVSQEDKSPKGKLQNTVLTETALKQELPGQFDMVSSGGEEEVNERIDKVKYEKFLKDKVKLQDDLKKLQEELSLLTQVRIKEEQKRIIRESGVPQGWLAKMQAIRAIDSSDEIQPLNASQDTLQTRADIEKWKNKERLRKKMRQQTDETQRQLEIETTKEQNATARERKKRKRKKRNRIGTTLQSSEHGNDIQLQQIPPKKTTLVTAWKAENTQELMETPKLPALETSLYSADWQRRVPSGNQAYASASPNAAKFYQVRPHPDVLHMPTSQISMEFQGREPVFYYDDDYDESIQQQQQFAYDYQQQLHFDYPQQPVQYIPSRPKWPYGRVGISPYGAFPSPRQMQPRAHLQAFKQQQPQNNQEMLSSRVRASVPRNVMPRRGVRHNSVRPTYPSMDDADNMPLSTPYIPNNNVNAPSQQSVPPDSTFVDLPYPKEVDSVPRVQIERDGSVPVHDSHRQIFVESATGRTSPSRLFIKTNVARGNVHNDDVSVEEEKEESYA